MLSLNSLAQAPLLIHLILAFCGAFLAGAINSVAGGGTMITFPILLALGIPPVMANATNTVGIWPGAIGSIWGFRKELKSIPKKMFWLMVPATIGALCGALILRFTPSDVFEKLVPWLILFATVLFIVSGPIQTKLRAMQGERETGRGWWASAIALQFLVGLYGGYFGAGMSIMMLSILGVIGMSDMLEMTAMTSFLSLAINGIAGVVFAVSGLIDWPYIPVMALGAIVGGYGAAGIARKIGKVMVRRFVILVGLTLAVVMFVRLTR